MSSKLLNRVKVGVMAAVFAATQALVPAQAALATGAIDIPVTVQNEVANESDETTPGRGDQPVWCMYNSGQNTWAGRLGGSNRNRFALTQIPANDQGGLYIYQGQVWSPNRSNEGLKLLDDACTEQYSIIVPQVSVEPVCGLDNDEITWSPSDVYSITHTPWDNGASTVSVTITAAGYVFTDGARTATYSIAELDRGACPPTATEITAPAAPQQEDPCGLNNVRWVAGSYANTDQYTWTLSEDDQTLTATVNDPTLFFPGGATSVSFILDDDRGERCEVAVPADPRHEDPCGINNIHWVRDSYANTDDYLWTEVGRTLTVSLVDPVNNVFANGQTSISFELPADRNERCEVCTAQGGHYTAPWSFNPVAANGGQFEFRNDGLFVSTPSEQAYVTVYLDAGNTRLVDVNVMGYDTIRLASSSGNPIQVTAYMIYVDKDGDMSTTDDRTFIVYEPTYNGTVVTGEWQSWDAYNNRQSTVWGDGSGDPDRTLEDIVDAYPNATVIYYGFNQGTSNPGIQSIVQNVMFDCATATFGAPEVPVVPEPPVAQECVQVNTGRTIWRALDGGPDVREKDGAYGEVNADGFGNTMRLYAATDRDLTNVVLTFTATQGFQFTGATNTEQTPGAGALQGAGYIQAVAGYEIEFVDGMFVVTIESMPANSSISFNADIQRVGGVDAYMDSTMVGTIVDCPAVDEEEPIIDDEEPVVEEEVPTVVVTDPAYTERAQQAPQDVHVLPMTGSAGLNPLVILLAGALAYGVLYFAQPRRDTEQA